jgi:hypothetical protein
MKKKNQFILIGVMVIIIFIFLITKLLNLQRPINENHIGIRFEIHNCSSVEKNVADLRENFLKPLLEFSKTGGNKTETVENLFLPSVKCLDKAFCIPAFGINAIRYSSKSETLPESSMTSDSRKGDDETFFNNWNGGNNFNLLEKNLLKGNPKAEQLPSLNEIKKIDKLDKIFIDSFIIDKNCSQQVIDENKPYIYKSTRELRKYINTELEKNPKALEKGTVDKTIHIFIYCDGLIPEPSIQSADDDKIDSDKDGVIDKIDQCDFEPGEKKCDGCPCIKKPIGCESDQDHDGVCDDKDKCPNDFGISKYKGCPIPDCDKDGINDEKDKCKCESGSISNSGCPWEIKIFHNNSDGKFTVQGIESKDFSKYKIIMKIKQSATGIANGAEVTHQFSAIVCPNHDEANILINYIKDPVDVTITIVVMDTNGKLILSKSFGNLSMVCTISGECGFKNLDKIF